jgi:hypothetical protein
MSGEYDAKGEDIAARHIMSAQAMHQQERGFSTVHHRLRQR